MGTGAYRRYHATRTRQALHQEELSAEAHEVLKAGSLEEAVEAEEHEEE